MFPHRWDLSSWSRRYNGSHSIAPTVFLLDHHLPNHPANMFWTIDLAPPDPTISTISLFLYPFAPFIHFCGTPISSGLLILLIRWSSFHCCIAVHPSPHTIHALVRFRDAFSTVDFPRSNGPHSFSHPFHPTPPSCFFNAKWAVFKGHMSTTGMYRIHPA